MKGYNANIEKETLENTNFRKVLYTGKHSQLVLMSLKPNEEIGMEIHADNDQFFRFEKGEGKCVIDGNFYELKDGLLWFQLGLNIILSIHPVRKI